MLRLIALSIYFTYCLASNVQYNGAKVFTTSPTTEVQLMGLRQLQNDNHYDFWKFPSTVEREVDIMVKKEQLPRFNSQMKTLRLQTKVKINDVGSLIQASLEKYSKPKDSVNPMAITWDNYYEYDDIVQWMNEMQNEYPNLVRVSSIGQSYEGRDVMMMKISTNLEGEKPTVVSEAALHAREWIAPAVLTYIMNELVIKNNSYSDTLDVLDFIFVPVTNPDGYAYSWTDDRLWRKTRNINDGTNCFGTDGNRNYDFYFGGLGAADNPCGTTYHGEEAFSTPEASNIRDLFSGMQEENIISYIAWHSAAELILRPYANDSSLASGDEDILSPLCDDAVAALEAVNGIRFQCILGGDLYPASGTGADWVYEIAGATYTYTVELRDQGYGFILPEDQIIPSGEESFAFFQVIFEAVRDAVLSKRK